MKKKLKKEFLNSKNGLPIVKVNGFFIHSKYDPVREAEKIIEEKLGIDAHYILIGYGLGYVYNELFKKIKGSESKIIVVDPIFDIDVQQNEQTIFWDVSDFTEMNLISYLGSIKDVKIIASSNYDKLCGDEVKTILKRVKDYFYVRTISNNTIRNDALMWNINYINNLNFIPKDQPLSILQNKFSCPIVIASGGPSLTKQLEKLKHFKENILLIAAGSTINTLLAENIIPDIVVSIDGKILNLNHFTDINFENTKFFYSMQSYYEIRKKVGKPSFYFLSNEFTHKSDEIHQLMSEPQAVIAGGASVANYCLTIARYLSNGPIALIGQDLAYTNNQTHAKNNKGYQDLDEALIKERDAFYITGYYGTEKVLTDFSFFSMKRNFEALMEILPLTNAIYNCTEGGALIENMNNISFNEFLSKYVSGKVNKDFLFNTIKSSETTLMQTKSMIIKLKEDIKKFEIIKKKLVENLAVLSKNKLPNAFTSNILSKLDKNDKVITEIADNTSLSVGIELVNLEVLTRFKQKNNETKEETFNRVNQQSKFLYKSLIELTDKIKGEAVRILENLEEN